MKVGIIGSGGREHAICYTLKKSKSINEIYCFPGNAGTSTIANNIELNLENSIYTKIVSPSFDLKYNLSNSDLGKNLSNLIKPSFRE